MSPEQSTFRSPLSKNVRRQLNGENVTRIGIIHIDECDKLARRGGGGDGAWGGRDVGGEGVQQGMQTGLKAAVTRLTICI